jgi:hypothetical protein
MLRRNSRPNILLHKAYERETDSPSGALYSAVIH